MSKLLTMLNNLSVVKNVFPILTLIKRHLFTQTLVLTELWRSFFEKLRKQESCEILAYISKTLISTKNNYSQLTPIFSYSLWT